MKKIAVLIPCFNEEKTIEKVVDDFRKQLPQALIYVYVNDCTDSTESNARAAGAIIGHESRRGKGHVVRTMFREIDADIFVMVDGDDTYPADQVHELIEPIASGKAHMSTGMRLSQPEAGAFRSFHKLGNNLIKRATNILFDAHMQDVLTGYRCLDAFIVRSIPLLSKGFEIETELTLQTLDKGFGIKEIPIKYRNRPAGSFSKLNTYMDGFLVLKTIFWIFKDYRPLKFFSWMAVICVLLGLGLGSVPVTEFIQTGLVLHFPTAVLATGLVLVGLLSFATGFILDTINRGRLEQYHLLISLFERSSRQDKKTSSE